MCAIVDSGHVAPYQGGDKSCAVGFCIACEIGVERSQYRHAQPPCVGHAKRAKKEGIDHMHQVRPKGGDLLPDKAARDVGAKLWVDGHARAADAANRRPCIFGGAAGWAK